MGRRVLQMANDNQQIIKVLFWGMGGEFSYLALEGLLNGGLKIIGIITHAPRQTGDLDPIVRLLPDPPRSQLPLSSPYMARSINHLAWQNEIPTYEVRDLAAPAVRDQLRSLAADVAVVACFSRRIPRQILKIPRHGFLNLHPSLLPELRGPFPLFWTFRLGRAETGITVHFMDAGLDTGDIVMQKSIHLPDGLTGSQADALLAAQGAALLLDACRRLAAGDLPRRPQPAAASSYARPSTADFHIPTTWTARHAYNFIRGTAEWQTPFHVTGPGLDLTLRQAISYDSTAVQGEPLKQDGRSYWIQFTPGVLHAR